MWSQGVTRALALALQPAINPCKKQKAPGGGLLNKVQPGRLLPEVQPLTLLYAILAEKAPILYTFYLKRYPFHIPSLGSTVLIAHGCYVTSMSVEGTRMALDHSLTRSLTHSLDSD